MCITLGSTATSQPASLAFALGFETHFLLPLCAHACVHMNTHTSWILSLRQGRAREDGAEARSCLVCASSPSLCLELASVALNISGEQLWG